MGDTKQIDWMDYGVYYDRAHAMPTDWVHVASIDEGGGYDWTEFHAFWSPTDRRYFWAGDAGCSCNAWGDGIHGAGDFENGDRSALTRAIRAFVNDYSVSATAALDAMVAVRTFKEDR